MHPKTKSQLEMLVEGTCSYSKLYDRCEKVNTSKTSEDNHLVYELKESLTKSFHINTMRKKISQKTA